MATKESIAIKFRVIAPSDWELQLAAKFAELFLTLPPLTDEEIENGVRAEFKRLVKIEQVRRIHGNSLIL